ncbi:MAG: protein kinase [Pyrinomonadaceae bacterium]
MTLTTGTQIGPYEIVSQIGAGGMGEVYRARDTKLGRDVAIKVLPAAFSSDVDRLRRFEQEAQAAGALNHPNVLVIYQIDAHDGAPYIVSELLEGETLRDRMNGKSLPQRKAIDYALQTAHGLAAAHEKGIVHRDLKPDNLFVTKDGRVKILDFGLAKLTGAGDGTQSQTEVPTRRIDTDPGVVMGTIGYMSPEQLRGRVADHRSDIFSFGAILYEMLSGNRAFRGESTADTMSAILREEPPDLSSTNQSIDPALERVVNHCLEKNPEERFHSAKDLAFAIEALSGPSRMSGSTQTVLSALPSSRRRRREFLPSIAAGLLLIASVTMAALYFRSPSTDERPMRFVITAPEKATDVSAPVISPDGRTIAFVASADGTRFIYLRPIESLNAQRLAGTEEAVYPFWSPDSRYLGFFASNKLKKIERTGGGPQTICDARAAGGGTWNRDGVILFGLDSGTIHRVSAAGGSATPVLKVDESRRETGQYWPRFLPDGQHFVYQSWNGSPEDSAIFVTALDGTNRKLLLKNDSNAVYTPQGFLLFARDTTLMAQPFDATRLQLSGEPFPIAEQVTFTPQSSYSNFSISDTGVMLFCSGNRTQRQLIWFDRNGKELGPAGPPGEYNDIVLSPDEKKVAIQVVNGSNTDIWLLDLARGVPSRFTFDETADDDPVWSPDGKTIVFTSAREGRFNLYRKLSSGAGKDELLYKSEVEGKEGTDASADGRFILFDQSATGNGTDIWVLPLFGDGKPYALLQTPFSEFQGHFSADGRWFAYTSNESGRNEVYVQSFPPSGGKWLISNAGGAEPHWRRDGQELFYIAADRELMGVDVKLAPAFEASAPKALFQTGVVRHEAPNRYAVTGDGQRFLVNSPVGEVNQTPITVILNWTAVLKKN